MLELVRRYVRPEGRLFFTIYLNELTPGGHGLIDGWVKNLAGGEEIGTVVSGRFAAGLPAVEPFVDLDPAQPLTWAVYSKEPTYELIESTGWRVLSLSEPGAYIQHHFLCEPV